MDMIIVGGGVTIFSVFFNLILFFVTVFKTTKATCKCWPMVLSLCSSFVAFFPGMIVGPFARPSDIAVGWGVVVVSALFTIGFDVYEIKCIKKACRMEVEIAAAEKKKAELKQAKENALKNTESAFEEILSKNNSLIKYREKIRELDRCLTKISQAALTRNLYYTKHDSAILGGAVSAVAGTGAGVVAALQNEARNAAVDEHNKQVAGKEYERKYSGNSNRVRFFSIEESIVEMICEAGASASDKQPSPLSELSSLWGQDYASACIKCKEIIKDSAFESAEFVCALRIEALESQHELVSKLKI